MKSYNWFGYSGTSGKSSEMAEVLLRFIIGAVVGVLFFAGKAPVPAFLVWGLTAFLSLLCIFSTRIRASVGNALGKFGRVVGRVMSWIILAPVYLVFFPIGRLISLARKTDSLNLRTERPVGYWTECDTSERKEKNIGRMFASERTSAKRRSWLVVVVILAVTLVSAELILRLFGFGHPVLYMTDSEVGYYPAPKQETVRLLSHRIYVNSYGMRAPEISEEKPPGTVRIFMIGDSTLYGGSYIDQKDIYARLLEDKLDKEYTGTDIQVLNIGVNAWGPLHELGYVKKFGTFDSDIAVICLPIGDIFRHLTTLWELPFMSASRPPVLAMEEVAVHLLWRYWGGLKKYRDPGEGLTEEEKELKDIRSGVSAYVRLAEELRKRGCEVFVEILPSRQAGTSGDVPPDEAFQVETLTAALEQAGYTVGYPAGLFGRTTGSNSKRSGGLYHDDVHLGRAGHRLYADYLAHRLGVISGVLGNLKRTETRKP